MKKFLISIDTEGDNLWNWEYGKEITTENSLFVPRFQNLCEKYGFKPTYLIHGHIHLYDMREERIGVYNNTTVINAYAHHILEIPEAFSNL